MSEMLEMKRLEEERSETGVNVAVQSAESSRVSPSPLYNGDTNMLQNLTANDLLQSPKRPAPEEEPLPLDTKRARLEESTPPRTNVTSSIVDTYFADTGLNRVSDLRAKSSTSCIINARSKIVGSMLSSVKILE